MDFITRNQSCDPDITKSTLVVGLLLRIKEYEIGFTRYFCTINTYATYSGQREGWTEGGGTEGGVDRGRGDRGRSGQIGRASCRERV